MPQTLWNTDTLTVSHTGKIPISVAKTISYNLPIDDLISFAQVSKSAAIAYNSADLWVYKLKALGVWNNASTEPITTLPSSFDNPLTCFDKIYKNEKLAKLQVLNIYRSLRPYYNDLVTNQNMNNLKMFKSFKNPVDQSIMLMNLTKLRQIDLVHRETVKEKLNSILELFENAIIRELEVHFDQKDYENSKVFTNILINLQNEQTLIDFFLQKSLLDDQERLFSDDVESFFIKHPKHHIDLLSLDENEDTSNFTYIIDQSQFQKFVDNMVNLFNSQSAVIDAIFPQSVPMMYKLSEEIISNHLVEYWSLLIKQSKKYSNDTTDQPNLHIEIVPLMYRNLLKFLKSVKPSQNAGPSYLSLLQELIEMYYEPFIMEYFEEETSHFTNYVSNQVFLWKNKIQENEVKKASEILKNVKTDTKNDLLTSFKKIFSIQMNPGGNGSSNNEQETEEEKFTEFEAKIQILNENLKTLKEIFSLDLSISIINLGKQATNRLITFQGITTNDVSKISNSKAQDIFIDLIELLGFEHIKPGFDKAIVYLKSYNPSDFQIVNDSVEPLILFTELVNIADLIQQMISIFYQEELVNKKIIKKNSILTPALQSKKKFEGMLDNYVADGLNIGIDVLIDEIESVFVNLQDPQDFNPLSDQQLQMGPTRTAAKVVEILSNHVNLLVGSTDKAIVDVFQQEIGERFFTSLCKHLKKQTISVTGAITLISDLNYYYDFIVKLKQRTINPFFVSLKNIGSMYLISGSDSKSIGKLVGDLSKFNGIFQQEELYEFVQRRADWTVVKKDVEKVMYGFGAADCVMV